MKKLYALIWLALIALSGFAQQPKTQFPAKIKVVLLGTFHFAGTTDRNKTAFADEMSPARQQQMEAVANGLAKLPITKIFVEAEPSRQHFYDSLYNAYNRHEKIDSSRLKNEIVQLAFRTAAKRKLNGVRCADFQQELPYAALDAFEKSHKDLANPAIFEIKWPFTDKTMQKKLADVNLQTYFKQMNSPYSRKSLMFDYVHYAMAYTADNDYTGVSLTTATYDRNLKIYTNILRSLTNDDNTILIIFGATHTTFLRQFFENHPSFEIVELDNLF